MQIDDIVLVSFWFGIIMRMLIPAWRKYMETRAPQLVIIKNGLGFEFWVLA